MRRRRAQSFRLNVWMAVALGAASMMSAGSARADELDTILLNNGGRLQGTVVEDQPSGVRVKLADGTLRTVPRAEIAKVRYASDRVAPAAPAPTAPAPAAPAPAAPAPAAPAAEGSKISDKPLMLAGIVLMPVGVVAVATGIGLLVAAKKSGDPRTPEECMVYAGGYPCGSHTNKGLSAAGVVTLIAGAATAATGVVLTIVGNASPAPRTAAPALGPVQIGVGVGSVTLRTSF